MLKELKELKEIRKITYEQNESINKEIEIIKINLTKFQTEKCNKCNN